MAFGRLKKVDLQEVSLICSALQLPEGLKSLCAGIMAEGTCGATVVIARVSVCLMTMRLIGMMEMTIADICHLICTNKF